MKKQNDIVYLIGEAALVMEWGEQCHAAGYNVVVRINPNDKPPVRLPKHFTRSTTVPRNISMAVELTNIDRTLKEKNLRFLDARCPPSKTILSSSVTVSATEQATLLKHPQRLVGIGALPTLMAGKLIELAPTVFSDHESLSQATDLLASLGKEPAVIQDRAGMVMPRILCMLINESSFALMEDIASPSDIDVAMKLGTNYPHGPIEWADRIGIRTVVSVLEAIHRETGEERYRTAPLLRQMALGKKWW